MLRRLIDSEEVWSKGRGNSALAVPGHPCYTWAMSETKETQVTGQQVYEAQQVLRKCEVNLSNAYDKAHDAIRKGAMSTPHDMTARERSEVEAQQAIVLSLQQQVGGPVYRIPSANVDHLRNEIEKKVNKRAAKLELPAVKIIDLEQEIIESPDYENRDEHGRPGVRKSIFQYVAINGQTPKVAGYEFVATLQHEEAGNIVRKIPTLRQEIREIEIPELNDWRTAAPTCEQCGLKRHRKDTYLVFNSETGDVKQVGSNCLGDFLGAADPLRYASYAEYLRDFLIGLEDWSDDDDERYYGPRAEKAFEMREYLTHTARVIRASGWNPASTSDYPTSTEAWNNLDNYGRFDKDTRKPLFIEVEEQDEKLADETLEWVKNELLPTEDKNDYQHNLSVALQASGVTYRTKGIVASAVRAFDRERENKLRHQKQQEKNAVKGHVGTVGEREDFDVKLIKTIWIEDRYASHYADDQTKPLYIFEDEAGNELKWFSSNDLNLQEGDTYTLKATVKAHDDHPKFGKSTMITRAKVVS